MVAYLAKLSAGRQVLWCYLAWYLVMAVLYFDPSPSLWLTALGISAIMGVALFLALTPPGARPDRWHVMRLFLIPFCVASFSALVKDRGFILVFSPSIAENALALSLCAAFLIACLLARRFGRRNTAP
jgi:hypothetical protein